MLDRTVVCVNCHAAGVRGDKERLMLGRRYGGFLSKNLAKAAPFCLSLFLIIGAEQIAEVGKGKKRVREDLCDDALTDRGHDSDDFRQMLKGR